ncbi:ATP-binding cassette domain-containing protein, partial [Chloroflexota bacterium]
WIVRFKFIIKHWLEKIIINEQISRFDIMPREVSKTMEEFSGGNQQKAVLAKWLATRSKILILDEPTVGVDIQTREILYNKISEIAREKGVSIVMLSTDMRELMRCCDRVLIMRMGKIVAELPADESKAMEALKIACFGKEG